MERKDLNAETLIEALSQLKPGEHFTPKDRIVLSHAWRAQGWAKPTSQKHKE